MSLNKKVVWLPYDMDTAIGINNSGRLAFSYNLEDTDLDDGDIVFNGQNSVLWNNLRDAFGSELKTMYKNLRSQGVLSYNTIEQMFQQHQNKWPEAIFNEDAYFKYIKPLIDPEDGKSPDASYLPMALGSKAEQRKWWLYNRFKYLDSKYNAGDSLTDYIMLRAWQVGDISITPYADIYPTITWDNQVVQVRGFKGNTYTLHCPKQIANDAVVSIYSASQLASIGDISSLNIRTGDFSRAIKLQDLKIGDGDPNYSNTRLNELTFGSNTLLKTLDVRNCPNLTVPIDLTGCINIEQIYFDGSSITGIQLPNGGVLNTLHLPSTLRSLVIKNQPNLIDLTIPDYSNITSLSIENVDAIDSKQIVKQIADNANVRLIGIDWDCVDETEFKQIFNKVDTFGGLDENDHEMGANSVAQLTGEVYTPEANKAYFRSLQNKYPYVEFTADELTSLVSKYLDRTLTEYNDTQVTKISQYAFNGATALTHLYAPNVTQIETYAFYQCSNLTGDLVFEKVVNVGNSAFGQCSKITSLYIGGNNAGFDVYAVRDCSRLKEIRVPKAKATFSFQGGGLSGNSSLELIDFGNGNTFGTFSGTSCPLHTIILRKTSVCSLISSGNLDISTAFKNGGTGGTIYIPETLYNHLGDGSSSDYKASSNWAIYDAYGTITWKKIEGSEYELTE